MPPFILKRLPIAWQVRFWCGHAMRYYSRTSHFRIEAIRGLWKTSGLLLKECKPLVDAELARRWGR